MFRIEFDRSKKSDANSTRFDNRTFQSKPIQRCQWYKSKKYWSIIFYRKKTIDVDDEDYFLIELLIASMREIVSNHFYKIYWCSRRDIWRNEIWNLFCLQSEVECWSKDLIWIYIINLMKLHLKYSVGSGRSHDFYSQYYLILLERTDRNLRISMKFFFFSIWIFEKKPLIVMIST